MSGQNFKCIMLGCASSLLHMHFRLNSGRCTGVQVYNVYELLRVTCDSLEESLGIVLRCE